MKCLFDLVIHLIFSFYYRIIKVVNIFWIRVLSRMYVFQIFPSHFWFSFSFFNFFWNLLILIYICENNPRDSCIPFTQIHQLFTFYHICLIILAFLLSFSSTKHVHTCVYSFINTCLYVCTLCIKIYVNICNIHTYKLCVCNFSPEPFAEKLGTS